MNTSVRKNISWLIALVLIIAVSAVMMYEIERDFGNVEVQHLRIMDPNGDVIAVKIFRPLDASKGNEAAAVLNMHGYQNDKNVQDSFSIELARRGFVVMAPDSLGHGDSTGRLNVAGWFADPNYVMGNETALAYLITLPFVDPTRIGVMGHSMGGRMPSSCRRSSPITSSRSTSWLPYRAVLSYPTCWSPRRVMTSSSASARISPAPRT